MDIERERGITIKLNTVRLSYKYKNEDYMLNLIDTHGHVDFSYEVSRSLAASDGAILVVDATQGVETQTIANMYLALENDLEIIPVINKIDLPSTDVSKVKKELVETFGFNYDEISSVSAKIGVGIKELVDALIERVPSPKGSVDKPLKSLIFDSLYDSYRGILTLTRVFDGELKLHDKIEFM